MPVHRNLLFCVIAVAVLMVMFPPWLTRERSESSDWRFSPSCAGGYAFVATPPTEYLPEDEAKEFPVVIARLDVWRLVLQFLALGGVASLCALAGWSCNGRSDAGPRAAVTHAGGPSLGDGTERFGGQDSCRADTTAPIGATLASAVEPPTLPRWAIWMYQGGTFVLLWGGHAVLTYPRDLWASRTLDDMALAGAIGESLPYTIIPWCLFAPLIHRMLHGTFRGATAGSLLIASAAGLVFRLSFGWP